jgi:hypothetical protein
LLLSATPAGAKGRPDDQPVAVMTISGSGLDGPILLNGDRVWHVLYLSTFRGVGLGPAEPPSRDRLGRALEARYRFVQPGGDVQTLRQTLYPCASDGRTWTFTPAGQDRVHHRIGSEVQTGWWHSVGLARAVGGADLGSACRTRVGVAAGGVPSGTGPITPLWIGIAALILIVGFGLVGLESRRRRQHQPVRT